MLDELFRIGMKIINIVTHLFQGILHKAIKTWTPKLLEPTLCEYHYESFYLKNGFNSQTSPQCMLDNVHLCL